MDIPAVEIIRSRYCERCQAEQSCRLVRNITASGVSQVYWICTSCNSNTKKAGSKGGMFISHYDLRKASINPDTLPAINDYRENGTPCEVCGSPATELHHYAPRHLFDNADSWATGYLCKEHHDFWHDTVTPNMGKRT